MKWISEIYKSSLSGEVKRPGCSGNITNELDVSVIFWKLVERYRTLFSILDQQAWIVAAKWKGTAASYNITLNLSSIFSSFPLVFSRRLSAKAVRASCVLPICPHFPGPWGFFTSGYMIGLFLMAFLLHRMQNVIIPSRSFRRRVANNRSSNLGFGSFRHIYLSLLPLNLSRTSTRLAVHLPSLYFLSKMLLLWFLLVLQTSDMFPRIDVQTAERWHIGWIAGLDIWSRNKEMSEICWSTFCAICGAFSVEGFVRALDGIGGGFPLAGNMNPNTSPFNLVGYAFLLHIYSSPITHMHQPDGFPSRPDKHVMITITIPLLQLTIFHYLSVSKRLSSHPDGRPNPSYHRYMSTQSSPNYPLLNYIPNIFETMLILTILFSICLNALAQLLVRGRVERLLSGLGLMLMVDTEDGVFGIHLPLEATGLRGWGNEVAPISIPIPGQAHQLELPDNEYGMVRMGRTGVGSVDPSYSTSNKGRKKKLRGFQNEVRRVDVGVAGEGTGRRGGWLVWCRFLWQFLVTWAWAWARAGFKWRREKVDKGVGLHEVKGGGGEEEDMYGRFLRGEDISDDDEGVDSFDEDDDYEEDEEDDEEEAEVDGDSETAALIRDLVRSSADGSEVVLAHILHGSRGKTSPLTRRRWGALARQRGREQSDDELSEGERENARHWCVICTSEAREVICWPCRCLAMCDGCREALATRSAPTKHRCPCCYSRVFIP
ncbi:hypothetical protein BDQ17DRAFT_1386668 [Cyathus striatus]|nr:hypothetical protein BDQ17DRAFT_1386668 [Cyathus striatus]